VKPNGKWHQTHRMPTNPTRAQRVRWHAEHSVACGCRPVPAGLELEVKALKAKTARAN
jgi:hypothetical protein